ncbi:MAG: UDP-N-acetyl glucosamine 2-epimerase [Thiobacillus sp.]
MIHFVIGTRAQLFKMAPLMRECDKRGYKWRWVYTAQHKDTIENTLKIFELKNPDYVLFDWSTEAKTISNMWYWLLNVVPQLLKGKKILDGYTGKKHVVLTHGDTFTTWWGALLGRLNRCNVMHVESGLRSFNIFKPFPEEINRLITFRLSNIYACPGKWAIDNLNKYKGKKINTIQNTQIDVLRFGLEKCEKTDIEIPKNKYVVASIHRYENIFKEERFAEIIDRIEGIADKFKIYWVQHPATKEQLNKLPKIANRLKTNKNIILLPRLEYLQFIKLVKHSEFVITDGGGNQEELFHLGKPTLLFRNETERQEGLGVTAVISKLEPAVINDFVKNYKKYSIKPFSKKAEPTKVISDYLRLYAK